MVDQTVGVHRPPPFLNTPQAAHYLGLTTRHLERMRSQRRGPVYRRHGRYIFYHIDDLDTWSCAHSSLERADA